MADMASTAGSMGPEAADGQEHAATLMMLCPVCGSDGGETLGVTGAFGGSLAAAVVMQCEDCGTVYLAPPYEKGQGSADATRDAVAVFERVIDRQKLEVSAGYHFMLAPTDEAELLARCPEGQCFDHILLPLALESSSSPAQLLQRLRRMLKDDGTVDVVVGNVRSSCFEVFGGRHWFAYRFPGSRQHFSIRGIERLAEQAGFKVTGSRTVSAPEAWLQSVRNWLADWRASKLTTKLMTGGWVVPAAVAYLIEAVAAARGKGAILVARLEKN